MQPEGVAVAWKEIIVLTWPVGGTVVAQERAQPSLVVEALTGGVGSLITVLALLAHGLVTVFTTK